jgi:hypothetical protein
MEVAEGGTGGGDDLRGRGVRPGLPGEWRAAWRSWREGGSGGSDLCGRGNEWMRRARG